jgi:hypothetical protein
MAYITDQSYYGSADNYGSYSTISLSDIVRNYMAAYTGEDQAVDNVPRWRVLFFAKRAIQELNYDALRQVKVLEQVIDSDLKMIMPHDYVGMVRLSLERNGILFPLVEDTKRMSAIKYQVDANNDLVFNGSGYVIEVESELDASRLAGDNELEDDPCTMYSIGAKFYLDPSKANTNPLYSIDRNSGVINFNSEMDGETVVLEYVSDGMENGDDTLIKVHKFFEEYVYGYITYQVLKGKRGIPEYEIRRSEKYKTAKLRNAKIRIGDFTGPKLRMALRGKGKWIK